MTDVFGNIEKLERDLWEAADNLRANSKLTSSDYFMPVLGVIFLRHAANRFDAAHRQIEADQASGKMPKRKILPADYIARRSLHLPESARYDTIMQQASVTSARASSCRRRRPVRATAKRTCGRRLSEEGLSNQELALFDLLFREKVSKADRERLKQASKSLLASLKALLQPMPDWTQKEATQAEVKVFILDDLYRSLPRPPFTEAETEEIAEQVYEYVWQRSAGQDAQFFV